MSDDLILSNARLVLADTVMHGCVVVRDGVLAVVDAGGTAGPGAEDLDGDLLIPGLVELHTDNLERHVQPRPGVHWPPLPAVVAHDRHLIANGITTVLDAIAAGDIHEGSARVRNFRDVIDALAAARNAGLVQADHFLHLRCELSFERVLDLFSICADDPRLSLVSVMDHTPGQRQYRDAGPYRAYYRGRYGLDDAAIDTMIERQRANSAAFADHHRRVIVDACAARAVAVASHDDATPADVAAAAADGMVIAEFPTTAEAAAAARDHGLAVLAGAPNLVLGGSHSGNVAAAALARAGLVDVLSSDYVPSSLLHGALLLCREPIGLPLPAAIATVSATPAALVGFTDRGEIAVGRRADLVRCRVADGVPVVRGVWRGGRRLA